MPQVIHKVMKGDTMLSICLAWDLTYDHFVELNPDFGYLGHRYAGDVCPGDRVVVGYTHRVLDRIRIQEKKAQR